MKTSTLILSFIVFLSLSLISVFAEEPGSVNNSAENNTNEPLLDLSTDQPSTEETAAAVTSGNDNEPSVTESNEEIEKADSRLIKGGRKILTERQLNSYDRLRKERKNAIKDLAEAKKNNSEEKINALDSRLELIEQKLQLIRAFAREKAHKTDDSSISNIMKKELSRMPSGGLKILPEEQVKKYFELVKGRKNLILKIEKAKAENKTDELVNLDSELKKTEGDIYIIRTFAKKMLAELKNNSEKLKKKGNTKRER